MNMQKVKPIPDGRMYVLEGRYYFYARIRDDGMIQIPKQLVKAMELEKDDLVDIMIQKC